MDERGYARWLQTLGEPKRLIEYLIAQEAARSVRDVAGDSSAVPGVEDVVQREVAKACVGSGWGDCALAAQLAGVIRLIEI